VLSGTVSESVGMMQNRQVVMAWSSALISSLRFLSGGNPSVSLRRARRASADLSEIDPAAIACRCLRGHVQ
jgi:hypothetical protein